MARQTGRSVAGRRVRKDVLVHRHFDYMETNQGWVREEINTPTSYHRRVHVWGLNDDTDDRYYIVQGITYGGHNAQDRETIKYKHNCEAFRNAMHKLKLG